VLLHCVSDTDLCNECVCPNLVAAEIVKSLDDTLLNRGLCLTEAGGPCFASSSRGGAHANSGGRALGAAEK